MKYLFLISLFSLLTLNLAAQSMGNAGYQRNTTQQTPQPQPQRTDPPRLADPSVNQSQFNIKIHALYNRKADAQLAIFNLVQLGKTAQEADTILYGRITRFIEGAMRMGISKDDIYVDMISQIPIYEMEMEKKRFAKNYTEVPRGIEVQRNLHVRFYEGNQLERLVAIAASCEIYDLVKVEYFVKNPAQIYDSLRLAAIDALEKRIKAYQALGVDLSESYRIFSEQQGVVYPFDRYQSYQGFSSSSVDALRKRDAITKVYKPKTIYYNKLPESQYDIVLNASILEPVVQFTYSLHMRMDTPQRPAPEVKTQPQPQVITKTEVIKQSEFFLVTPDGKIQTMLKTETKQ